MIKVFIGTVRVKLLVPVDWESSKITEINLDFSKVNHKLESDCQRETFNNKGNMSASIIPSSSFEFCGRLAAAISGVSYRVIEKMNSYDADIVTQVVRAYMNKSNPQKFYEKALKTMEEDEDEDEDAIKVSENDSEGETGEGFTKPAAERE